MASRVTVTVNVRDLTRGELQRMRRNFNSLGQDINRAVGNRTRTNFNRLSQSVNQTRRDLTALRGSIPDSEFFRLDEAIRRSQRTLQRGFANVGDRAFARVVASLRDVEEGFRRLDDTSQIRVRVDNSALRRADAQLAAWRRQQARNTVRVRVDPDTRGLGGRFVRSVGRHITGPFRALFRTISGVLSDGLGQGIIGAFRGAGPIAVAVLAASILGAITFLGAAIAGILVLAIGGAFTILGGALVFLSDKVRKRWTDTLERLKPLFAEAAKPMEPVVEHIRVQLEKAAKAFAPHFQQALAGAAPHVETFFNRIMEGFKILGKKASGPLEEAFNVLLAALGPELKDMLSGLGDSLAALANTVSEHSGEIASAIAGIIGLITTAVDIINFFAQTWVFLQRTAGVAMANIIFGMANVVDASFNAVIAILGAFGKIPFIGEQFKKAEGAVRRFKDGVVSDMRASGQAILDANANADRLNKERRLRVNIATWNAQLGVARENLKKTMSAPARKKIEGDIRDLKAKIAAAEAALRNMRKNYTITMHYQTTGSPYPPSGGRELAHGGVVGAAATGGVRRNMTLVGEAGPEIVDLPTGSHVRSNPDTKRTLAATGGGGMAPMLLIVKIGETEIAEVLLDGPLPKAVKRRGGVEATFGKM